MDDNALIEVLERIADSLEEMRGALDGIHSEVRLLPAPLEEICSKTGSLGHLREISDAADMWSTIHRDEVVL